MNFESAEGKRAYELAAVAVDLVTHSYDDEAGKSGAPTVDDRVKSLVVGGSLQLVYRHEAGQMILSANLERRVSDFTWHIRVMNSLGVNVLNVVYSTAPTASECEIMKYSPGNWEERLCR